MTWSDFYLICFIVGGTLSLLSFLSGAHVHLPFHVHFPHGWFHGGQGVSHARASASDSSVFNFATIMAFLAWFGAMGYLLSHYYRWWSGAILVAALVTGFAGGAVVYFFFVKLFVENERPLRASDFDMIGVLGHLSVPIQGAKGTGELIYSQAGTRRSCGARSEDGATITRDTEVVVLRYERGVAYVRPLTELDEAHESKSV